VKVLENPPSPEVTCDEDAKKKEPLCSDLANFTCAPGDFNDGTGVSRGEDAKEEILQKVKASARTRLEERFKNALAQPESVYLKELARAATGLSSSPDCSDKNKDSEVCNALLAKGMAQISIKRLFPDVSANPYMYPMGPMSPTMTPPPLKDLDYLVGNPAYQVLEGKESAAIKKELTDPDFNDRLRTSIFPVVQKEIAGMISERIQDPDVRKKILLKVASIQFQGNDCSEMAGGQGPSLNSLFIPNAFYDPERNTFKYCNGFIITDHSEFKIVSVIAHELAHSIDPCNIAKGPSTVAIPYSAKDLAGREAQFPFTGVISCLRSPDSVGAKVFPPPPAFGGFTSSPYPMPAPGPGEDNFTPPPMPVTVPDFCSNDQIGESFADWTAAEITPKYLKEKHPELTREQFRYGYSNIFRGMCSNVNPASPGGMMGPDVHPDVRLRANRIILASPEIRKQMGCTDDPVPAPKYCGSGK
jgi:hypothetical protein